MGRGSDSGEYHPFPLTRWLVQCRVKFGMITVPYNYVTNLGPFADSIRRLTLLKSEVKGSPSWSSSVMYRATRVSVALHNVHTNRKGSSAYPSLLAISLEMNFFLVDRTRPIRLGYPSSTRQISLGVDLLTPTIALMREL